MLKVEHTDVFGWEAAIRGMRNPLNSWSKSDSEVGVLAVVTRDGKYQFEDIVPYLGDNDLKLMKNLSKAGPDHGKFLRYINVTVDITAPLYWWKEFDTYKVGTVANSCSTMHKIHAKEFDYDDFSHDHMMSTMGETFETMDWLDMTIDLLNKYRKLFLETKEKRYWWQLIQMLPTSYNQKRTVQLNYQVLKSMHNARHNHKLDEWHVLCEWMLGLPYFKEVCLQEGGADE